jgi:Zn-finger nucleic acid-binding protein
MAAGMNCPACKSQTVEQGFEGSRGAKVLLDVCPTCHGLWFDAKESIQLSSKGVLRLFRQMHGRRDGHYRLKEPLACPRCRISLAKTQDLARGNRFQYFRCLAEHGHFITFFQFLREKGIVRSLNAKEIAELKKHVQHLQCSDCGEAISLESDSACPRCRAPLCILDPKAMGSTIEGLNPAAVAAGVVAPAVAAQILMEQMKLDGFFRKIDSQVQAASMSVGTPPVLASSSSSAADTAASVAGDVATDVAVEVGVEVAATYGLDLLDSGIDFFFDIASGIGDLF